MGPCHNCGLVETRGTHQYCFNCNPSPHGEAKKYSAGCRCDECRAAARQQEQERAAGLRVTKTLHGTPQRYRNGCRCEPCVLASRRHRSLRPHGMSPAIWDELLDIEGGGCPICDIRPEDVEEAFHIDHSHNCTQHGKKLSCANCWRGLMCQVCNSQLERKIGHAYLRELEGLPATEEDRRILDYIRHPPADILRARHLIAVLLF